MEMGVDAGCVPAGGGSAGLLAEFRTWLDRERGLAPVSVRCYSKQAKAFLAAVGGPGAVSGLDAGKVTAFMVGCRRTGRCAEPGTGKRAEVAACWLVTQRDSWKPVALIG